MAFKRRKDDEPKGSAKRSLLGRGGSRDPFEHLQEERDKLEGEEQPWFLADDDHAEDFKVEAGISSNISNADLSDLPTGDEPGPVAAPPTDQFVPPSSESEHGGSSSVFEEPSSVFEEDEAATALEDFERDRTEIDGTVEPDRQAPPSPTAQVLSDEASVPLSPAEEPPPAPPPTLSRDAAAPIFDLPDHTAEPVRSPDLDQPPSPADASYAHEEPVEVESLDVEVVSDTPSQGLVAALPAVDAPQPNESPEGDAPPLERTLVQAFRDVVAQAPPAPPLDEPEGSGPQRVEPRKPRRPPRRPQGF